MILTASVAQTGDDGEGGSGLRRNGGKVEPSAGSAFSPPPPSFPSELPPIPGVGGGPNLSTSMAEPVRVLPLRAPSPITGTSGAASGGAAGGGGGGGGGVVRNSSFLPPVPTSAPMTEREKELAAKAELRRARRSVLCGLATLLGHRLAQLGSRCRGTNSRVGLYKCTSTRAAAWQLIANTAKLVQLTQGAAHIQTLGMPPPDAVACAQCGCGGRAALAAPPCIAL